ncbi:DNA methyltransferase [Largemouth bass virus]|uniref:DNA methyltransferase n=3 Tax=Alphairidovirinae TaxID=2017756 RepID=A0A9E7PPD5_9VIRU|nr:DNA methyltransferase [Largemouth bass ulcerative syndrome virus]UUY86206.1 DNA methyltransferase [Largemouth bass virus]WAK75080.1 putative cytosine DNA methyltransferase [Mandarin fish ranavirus]WHA35506.1 putative DNA methyltransferase [Micropterus salmoides ranavirus]WHA35611.1 putative DNA methyltransferase [Siniperca chuatsi ranavirus]
MAKTVLDIFSGTHSVSKACDVADSEWRCTTVDLTDSDYNVDVLTWDYKRDLRPGQFDLVWASPPCRFFSRLRDSNTGRYGITKESLQRDLETKGLPLLEKALDIIDYLKPKHYIIENPETGRMKDYMTGHSHHVLDYCAYADWGYRKRTRLWTDVPGFSPRLCAGYGVCPSTELNVVTGRWGHRLSTDSGTRGRRGTTRRTRYRVPPELIRQLLNLCQDC